ncbi:MAG: AgmX/PglI C-terminal domain-containing protein [Polyangia bacterium]
MRHRFLESFSVVGLIVGIVGLGGGLFGAGLGAGCSPRRSTQSPGQAAAPVSPSGPSASPASSAPAGPTARPRLALPRTSHEAPRPLTRVAPERLLQAVPPPPGPPAGAPLSLTTSDGTGLVLQSLKASAVVSGPLAFTELHLVFDNPDSRVLEGRFEITLPPGAAVSRFAMLMPDGWREAEVIERQRARAVYEDFLHRRQDPALLEREAGNRFSARVFPIPPRGRKELKLSYSQELADTSRALRLPLCGLPRLGRLEIVAIHHGHGPLGDEVTQVIKQDVVPDQDFEIRPPLRAAGGAVGLRSDRLAVARIKIGGAQPAPALAAEQPLDKVLLLVDTSASRAAGFAQQLELVAALSESLKQASPQATLQVAAFDQSVAPVFLGPIGALTAQKLAPLSLRGPLGASDLEGALRYAGGQGAARIVLITDGIATAQGGAAEQRAAAAALGNARLDVILVGGIRDEAAMRGLTTALPRPGLVLDGAQPAARLVERLRQPVLNDLAVTVAGARWHWPTALSGVQPGDERLIYAELADDEPGQSLRVTLRGAGEELLSEVPLQGASAPLLERAYVQARIAELSYEHELRLATDKPAAAALRKDIIALSTRHRVLSDFTSLLVLETEEDYARFRLDRRALADILTVGERGLELLRRQQDPEPASGAPTGGRVPGEVTVRHTSHSLRVFGRAADPADPADPASPADPPTLVPTKPSGESPQEAASRQARAAMAQSGILGIRVSSETASRFGGDSALGRDEDTLGELVGDEINDSFGAGGLGLLGTGQGGGGSGAGSVRRGGQRRSARPSRPRPTEVALGASEVSGGLDPEIIRRIVRRHLNEVHFCYERELARHPELEGRARISFTIAPSGMVSASSVESATEGLEAVAQCIAGAVRRWGFPQPRNSVAVQVGYPFELKQGPAAAPSEPDDPGDSADEDDAKHPSVPPYTGTMLEVMTQLGRGRTAEALRVARVWRQREPGDVLALTALGAALAAAGERGEAERAFGSILDLYPARADLRRFAGSRLEALRSASGLHLAVDTYKKAVEQRPDHPSSHRLYAYALAQSGQLAAAFAALRSGLAQRYPDGRFLGVEQVLREDLGILAAAWRRAEPARAAEIQRELDQAGVALASEPSLRFVLTWETDANDVDFHIYDGQRGHAFYSQKQLRSGGELYADVTTGYGPECFAIRGRAAAFPYRLEAHYYSRGPMGYGMGKLQILSHDGKGGLRFEDRPFVIMNDDAYIDLGRLVRPL